MKFGDKLVLLRKKNGLSQEELAEKLGVSRQSVSKWESNNTYPETDKIVQICNIFDCSMDDLINEKVTNIEETSRKSKNNLNEVWDSLLEFITKTINMFSHMSFMNGLKCLIEMIVVCLLLWFFGSIFCSIASSVVANLFSFLGNDITSSIKIVLKSIFNIFWFVLALIILVHTFKIRYLNYYDYSNEKIEKKEIKNVTNEAISDEKIIIRDEKDKPFAFLSVFSKIIIWFIKFIVICFALGIIGGIISLVILDVLSISFIGTNVLFLGVSISLIAATVISVLCLLLCIYFVISKKVNAKVFIFTFLGALLLFGVGIGISVISFKNIDIIEDKTNEYYEDMSINTKFNNDLVVLTYDNNSYKYVIDSNMGDDDIIVSKKIDSRYEKIRSHESNNDEMNTLYVFSEWNEDIKEMYNKFINDLKDNKIHINAYEEDTPLTIKANEATINKLLNNLKKLYLVEEYKNDDGVDVIIHDSKVFFEYGIDGYYDAREDKLFLEDDDMQCERSIKSTKYGDRIIYKCLEKEDD